MSREPNTPRGLFHNDGEDGVVHVRCPDCGGDVGVDDCGDACAFRALDDAEIEAADGFTDPEFAAAGEAVADLSSPRLIEGSACLRQDLTDRSEKRKPNMLGGPLVQCAMGGGAL